MRRDRRCTVAALLCLLTVLLAGCSSVPRTRPPAQPPADPAALAGVTLKVGDQRGGSQSLLRAAGLLDDLPYRIEWTTFTSGPPLIEAARAGAIDLGGTGNTPAIFAAAARARVQIVSANRGNVVSDAVLVPAGSPLRSAADLRGRRIAVAKGSSAHGQLLLHSAGRRAHPGRRRPHVPRPGGRLRGLPPGRGRRVGRLGPVHRAGRGRRRPGARHR